MAMLGTAIDRSVKRTELGKMRAQRGLYENLTRPAGDEDYFKKLVTINVSMLKEYYFLVKTHTRASFLTSIAAGILGFGLVVVGLAAGYAAKTTTFTAVAAGSGVLMQFISGVFFYLYNRTVRQLKEYHDSLLDVQDVLLALKVLEGVQDPTMKAETVKSVVMYLMAGNRKLRSHELHSDKNAG
jgi:hypothetical protein